MSTWRRISTSFASLSRRSFPKLPQRARLHLMNGSAIVTQAGYELIRPLLRALGILRRVPEGGWVFGGHGGRLYADNAAAVHEAARRAGEKVYWVTSDRALARRLSGEGATVLRRNSFSARVAIENAAVLAYSHGITDLDHVLWRVRLPRGTKVHLNHSMHLLKAERIRAGSGAARPPSDPFDYVLASSERERRNFLALYPGRDADVLLGGGAHLDAIMAARGKAPSRVLVYAPTFRETPETRRALNGAIDALADDLQLQRYLEEEDLRLVIADHVNTQDRRAKRWVKPPHPRICFADAGNMLGHLLSAALLISDYSGLLCDYLALDRPIVLFPFDRQDYLSRRRLYLDYDSFAVGPRVAALPELVELLVSGRWQDTAPYADTRSFWQREFFPSLQADYAQRSLDTMRALARSGTHPRLQCLSEAGPDVRGPSGPLPS